MDLTYLLVLAGLGLCLLAEFGVKNAYRKNETVYASNGMTAFEAARRILDNGGCTDVAITQISGSLTDHYDPSSNILSLSSSVYGSSSVAAIGVAAHECGHALQKMEGYGALKLRTAAVPVVNIGSKLYFPVFLLGIVFSWKPLMNIGILCFALTLLFSLITLPVEFNASRRAVSLLRSGGYLTEEELSGARSVLNAAAMTYVASAISTALQLARLILLSRRNSRD